MKFNKKVSIICYMFFLLLLSNCIQSSAALLGPSLTVAKTGNVYQAGLSYVSNDIIKKKLGKSPGEFVVDFLNQDSNTNGLIHQINNMYTAEKKHYKINVRVDENEHFEFLDSVKKMLK
jgi:predicted nucleic acid-binding OB-fold protein|tara:strand:- start:816 stop:1172 length:357 start_codon:yes stop_codon:yes gene_type:complete